MIMAELWLRRLVAGLLPRRPGFDPGTAHVRFVVDKVALGVIRFSPVSFIPPVLHYKVKRKNYHLDHRVAQYASRLRCVRSI